MPARTKVFNKIRISPVLLSLTLFCLLVWQIKMVGCFMLVGRISTAARSRCCTHSSWNVKSLSSSASSSSDGSFTPNFKPYENELSGYLNQQQMEKLEQLAMLIYSWNFKTNLVSRKDIDNLIPNHIMPCLAISKVKVSLEEL